MIQFDVDMTVLAKSEEKINGMLEVKETKGMVIDGKRNKAVMKVGDEIIEQKDQFRYLRSIINGELRCEKEMKPRVALARYAFNNRINLFCGRMSKQVIKCYV